jgi:hypothetical protein
MEVRIDLAIELLFPLYEQLQGSFVYAMTNQMVSFLKTTVKI